MNKKLILASIFSVGFYCTSSLVTASFAGQIYVYKEDNGTTLLTNRKSSDRSLKSVKVTYYPDSNIHSYSNWGSSESAVLPSYSKNKNAYDHIIKQASAEHGVAEGLIKAVMHTESGFNVNARSPVGAQGLMQLMPATAKRFNVSNAYDPQQNIMAGAKYLSWLLNRFDGNTSLALAGYNAGEGNVAKYGGIPPFKETQDYVRRVTSRYNNLYSGGISVSNDSSPQITTQASSQSSNSSSNTAKSTNSAPKSHRQIIVAADGTFTDAPAGTYSTNNASASARISFSE
jgi:hypothetical protein